MNNTQVPIERIQYVAIIGSLFIIIFVFELVRSRKMKENYSILWLIFGLALFLMSVYRDLLDTFAHFIGIDYPPAAIFLLFIFLYFFILIQFSVVISRQSIQIKRLTQELSLLKYTLEKLNRSKKASKKKDKE